MNHGNLTGGAIEWIVVAIGENVFVRLDTPFAHFIAYGFDFAHHTQEITRRQFRQLFNSPSNTHQFGKQYRILGRIFQPTRRTRYMQKYKLILIVSQQ